MDDLSFVSFDFPFAIDKSTDAKSRSQVVDLSDSSSEVKRLESSPHPKRARHGFSFSTGVKILVYIYLVRSQIAVLFRKQSELHLNDALQIVPFMPISLGTRLCSSFPSYAANSALDSGAPPRTNSRCYRG